MLSSIHVSLTKCSCHENNHAYPNQDDNGPILHTAYSVEYSHQVLCQSPARQDNHENAELGLIFNFNGERSDTVYVGSAAGRSLKTRDVFMPYVVMLQSTSPCRPGSVSSHLSRELLGAAAHHLTTYITANRWQLFFCAASPSQNFA